MTVAMGDWTKGEGGSVRMMTLKACFSIPCGAGEFTEANRNFGISKWGCLVYGRETYGWAIGGFRQWANLRSERRRKKM